VKNRQDEHGGKIKTFVRHTYGIFSRKIVWFFVALLGYGIVESNHFFSYLNFKPTTWGMIYHVSSPFLVGGLTSFLFYFLVVYLPARNKHRIVKTNLKQRYADVKRDILYQIIFASRKGGRTDLIPSYETVERLSTVDGFRSAFQDGKTGTEGFYAFRNYINSDEATDIFQIIVLNLRILSKQIDFVLHNYPITDKNVFDVFKNLESVLIHIDTLKPGDYYDAENLSNFINSVFAGFSIIEGKLDYDVIEKTIEEM